MFPTPWIRAWLGLRVRLGRDLGFGLRVRSGGDLGLGFDLGLGSIKHVDFAFRINGVPLHAYSAQPSVLNPLRDHWRVLAFRAEFLLCRCEEDETKEWTRASGYVREENRKKDNTVIYHG